jgi:hypothetical protein
MVAGAYVLEENSVNLTTNWFFDIAQAQAAKHKTFPSGLRLAALVAQIQPYSILQLFFLHK